MTNVWCLAFSDLLFDSTEEKIQQGWIYITILGVIITGNLFFFMKRTAFVYLKEWMAKRKAKKYPMQADENC